MLTRLLIVTLLFAVASSGVLAQAVEPAGLGSTDKGAPQLTSNDAAKSSDGASTRPPSETFFGAGCRWDPTKSNIEEVTYKFRTGPAPPSPWFWGPVEPAPPSTPKLQRRHADPTSQQHKSPSAQRRHTRLIEALTFRSRTGTLTSTLNSAGCALPAFSQTLADLESRERSLITNFTRSHRRQLSAPSAMFFWAGLSNYNRTVRSDLIQTVVFYGDGCAAPPHLGLCVYSAEYSDYRYGEEDHMCMGSNMPVFYPVGEEMTVVYRTQSGFRTQEAWVGGMMVSYLRSAGDQVMNSFVITQECKGCAWPLEEQVYEEIRIRFSEKEEGFEDLGLCTGGASVKRVPRIEEGGKVWVIDEVRVPGGKHVTSRSEDEAGMKGDP